MTSYTVQLYTYSGDQIYGRRIECDRRDVPRKLAGIVVEYLRDNPHTGTIQALVDTRMRFTKYMIHRKNYTILVYRQVFQCNVDDVEE